MHIYTHSAYDMRGIPETAATNVTLVVEHVYMYGVCVCESAMVENQFDPTITR